MSTDIIASGGGADTAMPVPVPVSITWFLCQQCNQAFNLREKLNFHTQMSHRANAESKADQPQDTIQGGANNENSSQSQSNTTIENTPDEGEEVLLSLSQTIVPITNTNEVNFYSVLNEKHDSDLSSKMTEIMPAVSELEEEMSEEFISQIVNNKCDDTSVVIETEIDQCSSSENYSGDSISLLTSHPPPLELEVEKSEPQPPIVAESTTITETASSGPGPGSGSVEVEAGTNRKPRTTKPVLKYQTQTSLRLKRLSAKEVQNATMAMTQSVAEYTPGNSGNFGLGGTLDVNVAVKDSNHSNSFDILAPTVVTRHQLNLALSALISDSSPPQQQQQQLQLLPRRVAADTTRVSRKRTTKSKPRCRYGKRKKRQLARFRNRNRVQPTTPFPPLKRIKITKKIGPSWQAMTIPLVKANATEANELAISNSANYNDESYRKFKEELLTPCSLCDKDVPMSSFVLHVKYCGTLNSENQYHSSSDKAEEPSYEAASSPAESGLKLKTPVAEAEIRSLPRRNKYKNCTDDKNVTPRGQKFGAKLKPKLNSTVCTVAAARSDVLNNNEGILSSAYQNKAAIITDYSYGNIHDINYKFQCDICPRTFSTKSGLGLHKNAHSSSSLRKPRRSNTLHQHNISQPNRQFHPDPFQWKHQCPECGHRFFMKSHLQKHVVIKHGDISIIKIDATDKREGTTSLEEILNENTDADVANIGTASSSFKCNYCPRTFRTLNFLNMHKYSHAEYSGYGCSICNIGFRNSVKAEIHSRLHTGERPFVCNINNCSETFISNSFLEQHRRRNHNHGTSTNNMRNTSHSNNNMLMMSYKNFPCSLCPKKFVSKPSLRQHLMSHSDERKFKCPHEECTATYKTAQCFIEHLRLHTGETPYKCEICGRQYARQGSFRVHQRSHTDYYKRYQCQICGYYSRSNWALQNHSMMVHQELRIHSVLFKRNYI